MSVRESNGILTVPPACIDPGVVDPNRRKFEKLQDKYITYGGTKNMRALTNFVTEFLQVDEGPGIPAPYLNIYLNDEVGSKSRSEHITLATTTYNELVTIRNQVIEARRKHEQETAELID